MEKGEQMSDLISRKDAIELMKNDMENNGLPLDDEYNIGIDHAMCLLACVPTAEPKVGKWIPCEERLPNETEADYLICTDGGYMCSCRWTNANPFWTDLTTDWHWNFADIPQNSEVVAWMPLKPYEMERSE